MNIVINNRVIILMCLMILVLVLNIDLAYCGINDQQIKAASKTFIGTMSDWMPAIIGGGLFASGVCLFANNFKMGLAGLAGTGFLYAAKSFVGTGLCVMTALLYKIFRKRFCYGKVRSALYWHL